LISFRRREDVVSSCLILLSIIILTVTLLYMLIVPPPTVAGQVAGRERAKQQIQQEIADDRRAAKKGRAVVRTQAWRGNADTVSAALLAMMTTQTRQHSLKLIAFRPQRPQTLTGMTELPFTIQVSGPFPRVQAVMAALDTAGNRLTMQSVEIASTDENTDAVTATLGISAYLLTDPGLTDTATEANSHA
jgi:hypothetical protein